MTTTTARDIDLVLDWLRGELPRPILDDYLKERGLIPETRPEPRPVAAHVRWAIRRDFPALPACHPEKPYLDEAWFIEQCKRRDTIVRIVEVGDTPVGWICYRLLSDIILIESMAVHPDYRRSGLARLLLAGLDRRCEESRQAIWAAVPLANVPALLLFDAAGYRLHRHNTDWASVYLCKRVAPPDA